MVPPIPKLGNGMLCVPATCVVCRGVPSPLLLLVNYVDWTLWLSVGTSSPGWLGSHVGVWLTPAPLRHRLVPFLLGASAPPPLSPIPTLPQSGDPNGPTRLNQLPVRWAVLALQCVALIGSYYCYDNPTAIQNPLMAHFHVNTTDPADKAAAHKFNTNYNLLYSVYSFPNTVRGAGV